MSRGSASSERGAHPQCPNCQLTAKTGLSSPMSLPTQIHRRHKQASNYALVKQRACFGDTKEHVAWENEQSFLSDSAMVASRVSSSLRRQGGILKRGLLVACMCWAAGSWRQHCTLSCMGLKEVDFRLWQFPACSGTPWTGRLIPLPTPWEGGGQVLGRAG